MIELSDTLKQIQDRLVPYLDSYEQAIYHYLFRHSHLEGRNSALYSTRSAEIGFGTGDSTKKPSMNTRSKKLKSLEAKGCIKIIERTNKGILVEVYLPSEMPFLEEAPLVEEEIDLESLDFFKDRRLLGALLEREGYRCFYTGKKISAENAHLDHVVPQAQGGGNGYRNIVASSYDANSLKNDKSAEEFARLLYKDDLLSLSEFKEIMQKIKLLQEGKLVPDRSLVSASLGK
jgi:5-methylcytosine-specific restriction endonuclease McrA